MKDETEIFNERLKELNEHLKEIKDFGIDEDILISHLRIKLKISGKKVKEIINSYEDFYEKTIKKSVMKKLK